MKTFQVRDSVSASMELKVALGRILRLIRKTLRCSQEEFAHAAGLSRHTIAKTERGGSQHDT